MFWMKIWELIGIRGLLIIALLATIGVQYIIVKNNNNKINGLENEKTELSQKITKLNNLIDIQNSAVNSLEEYTKSMNDRLKSASGKIVDLSAENASLKGDLIHRPLASNCDSALTELKVQSGIVVEKWNKK